MVRDVGHPIDFHLDAAFQNTDPMPGSREGIWVLRGSTNDYLVITNSFGQQLDAVLRLYDATGKAWQQSLSLAPRQSKRLSVRSLVLQSGLLGTFGGITVNTATGAGSLNTAYFLFDELRGFAALMKMFPRDPNALLAERSWGGVHQWTTRAPMLPLTSPDPSLGIPVGIALQPKIFLRNTTAQGYSVNVGFNWRSGSASGASPAITLPMGPYETQLVDVANLQVQKLLPPDANWASVTLSAPVHPDDFMAIAMSYDETGHYGAQTPFRDQLASHWEAGKWEVDSMHNSLVTVGNGGKKSVRAQVSKYVLGRTFSIVIQGDPPH